MPLLDELGDGVLTAGRGLYADSIITVKMLGGNGVSDGVCILYLRRVKRSRIYHSR